MRFILRPFDIVAVAIALAVTGIATYLAAPLWNGGELTVEVRAPAGTWLYPLETDLLLPPVGGAGICAIVIESGTVRVTSSDCPNKICIQMGRISRSGQWIACLPHQVFIRIIGETQKDAADIDALVS